MRYLPATAMLCLLCACASNPANQGSSSNPPVAVRAFRDICLKTAPSFSQAEQEAKAYGVGELSDAGFMKLGFNRDQSLSVQVSADKECTVTTPGKHDSNLTAHFLATISQHLGTRLPQSVPVKARIGDDIFIFHHDREGGEAFVMMKQGG